MKLFVTSFRALGGPAEIQLAAPNETFAQEWMRAAIEEIDRIEKKYSRYRGDSLVSTVNRLAGREGVPLDPETRALIELAHSMHATSDGRFDLTSGVWRRAWDFRLGARIPQLAELDCIRPLVGWDKVEWRGHQLRLGLEGMELDFGGIGKEHAVDSACSVLIESGVQHALVNLAGDLRALGCKPDGSSWRVGIRDPHARSTVMAEIELANEALATSGNYERHVTRQGQRLGHILDSRTGWPVTYWSSITVKAATALLAGSISTLAFVMETDGQRLLDSSGVDYLAVPTPVDGLSGRACRT